MTKENQILLIQKYISSDENNILINQINDDIALFYLNIIRHFSHKQNIKINTDAPLETVVDSDDLFGTKIIKIYNITNAKKIDSVLQSSHKKIILTDYKNYKKLNLRFLCINGYQFEHDLNFFIRNELNINNEELIYYCKNNTALLFSETSKYLINSDQYTRDQTIVDDKNHILDIRKSIFENKRNNFDVKNLYQNIKKEAEYKKLSFLTY
jgi:hypothetical protein